MTHALAVCQSREGDYENRRRTICQDFNVIRGAQFEEVEVSEGAVRRSRRSASTLGNRVLQQENKLLTIDGKWRARRDSNPWPLPSESSSIVLLVFVRVCHTRKITNIFNDCV